MVETTQKAFYALYDFLLKKPAIDSRTALNFSQLTGGEMVVSTMKYNVVSESGYAAVKYLPGITTYTSVTLLRAFDDGAVEMVEKFKRAVNLELGVRGNYSVVMIDTTGNPQAMWHLINALPTKISGFSFNQHEAEYYEDFEITLQPEYIDIIFPD